MQHFTHLCVRVRNRYVHIASRRADFARSGGSRWRAIDHPTCHKRSHVQNRLLSVLNTSVCYSNIAGCCGLMRIMLLSYMKRNIMLCSLCLTIPFVIFRLIPISSFGKDYDDEE
ncbi:hypothetical protein T07_6734 [Trichinella nelsoni]|uniref:Transmembrane protein n=1 Tax=Trichinella nelsoni TaxID=6336 RepID=A0A0V0RWW9_9BILA|nr:hypothetical protein T07_6734 [Trichinella nelsoni]